MPKQTTGRRTRRYNYYVLASTEENEQEFYRWKEAFAAFQALKKAGGASATLYGADELGAHIPIMSF